MSLSTYAEAFSERGYACVVFDYRRWGASGQNAISTWVPWMKPTLSPFPCQMALRATCFSLRNSWKITGPSSSMFERSPNLMPSGWSFGAPASLVRQLINCSQVFPVDIDYDLPLGGHAITLASEVSFSFSFLTNDLSHKLSDSPLLRPSQRLRRGPTQVATLRLSSTIWVFSRPSFWSWPML